MAETTDYKSRLSEVLLARKDWLESSELTRLKDELRNYQASFSSLYTIYLKKGLINEDPYKQETKIGELEVPDTGSFSEAERVEQLSIRLSNYDNQLDFLVNFYQFGVEFLNLERIKRILGLVRYVDWVHLSPDSQSANTRAVAELTNQSKSGVDPLALSVIGESLTKLSRSTPAVMVILKELTDYNKEAYKLEVRTAVTSGMPAAEATAANIKKKLSTALPGKPFYQELVEELIKEDYSRDGPILQETILKSLKLEDAKPKAVKAPVSFKAILLEGIQVIGSVASTFAEIGSKLDENENLLANQKRSFWEKVKRLMQQMMNKEPDEVIYDIQYMDSTKGVPVRERVNFHHFRSDLDKRIRTLASLGIHGAAASKLETMSEDQLTAFLEKTIRDVQNFHRTLFALDDFFKASAPKEDRDKIKGVKPELATVKNAIVRANQIRHEYSAQKEEEEQMRRLGINPTV
ncbi:MAG: hypothetical protein LBN21_05715 [Treponema sp.]|jgi:hypothetical protein|nr:hypothetical protein [Treponema sp.]